MSAYYVKYRLYQWELEKGIAVAARNKAEAYDIAFYEKIPEVEGKMPYSAWVYSVTYNNGNCRHFNTSEGNAY